MVDRTVDSLKTSVDPQSHMKKYILSLFVAVTIASISSSTAATASTPTTASTANYVGIFGTNSSQTNFVIPAGDSVYIAEWFYQKNEYGSPAASCNASASINSVTKTVTNSISYVGSKPKIITVTNSITNSCNFVLVDQEVVCEGILIPGPATISIVDTPFQYKYFPKKSPYQVLLIQAGTTNPTSITIPAGQKLHQIKSYNMPEFDLALNNKLISGGYDFFTDSTMGFNNIGSDIYGPSILSFIPKDQQNGTGAPFYFSYILINSDATNIPITTP